MKLIIDISKEAYNGIKIGMRNRDDMREVGEAIENGTPLPDIFDLEGLKSDMKALNCGFPFGLDYLLDCLKKRLGITIN